MKRWMAGFAATAGFAMLLGAGVVWNEYLRLPAIELEPLPAGLIPLESAAGRELLAASDASADYDELSANFVPQSRKAYCSVASAITTLNAARLTREPMDQRTLFANPAVSAHPLKVSFIGMSLRDLGDLLRAHGARVTVVPASATDIEAFRKEVRSNLVREGDFLLINYERERIGQVKSGHISPVAAYHAPSDRLLILDVAAHRYPPVWAPLADVWDAMRVPLNAETTITRGYLVVHGGLPARNGIASAPVGAKQEHQAGSD